MQGSTNTHYYTSNNLPFLFLASNYSTTPSSTSYPNLTSFLGSLDTDLLPTTLSSSQCKLLNFHYKQGCINNAKIQQMAHEGLLGWSNTSWSSCDRTWRLCLRRPGWKLYSWSHSYLSGASHNGTISCWNSLINRSSHFLHFTPHLSTGCKESLTAKHAFELQASNTTELSSAITLIMASLPPR
jgi:hypothetical protein